MPRNYNCDHIRKSKFFARCFCSLENEIWRSQGENFWTSIKENVTRAGQVKCSGGWEDKRWTQGEQGTSGKRQDDVTQLTSPPGRQTPKGCAGGRGSGSRRRAGRPRRRLRPEPRRWTSGSWRPRRRRRPRPRRNDGRCRRGERCRGSRTGCSAAGAACPSGWPPCRRARGPTSRAWLQKPIYKFSRTWNDQLSPNKLKFWRKQRRSQLKHRTNSSTSNVKQYPLSSYSRTVPKSWTNL